MYILTRLQNKIFRLLCIKAGEKINQRRISKLVNATPSGVAKALKELEEKELVVIEKDEYMNLNLITLNRTSVVLRFKQLENLKQVYELKLVNFLEENFPGTTIILFGSYARGEDTVKSDVDIAIIEGKERVINLEFFEKTLERHININFYKSLKQVNKELKENICNGIVLVGGIEL